MKLTIHMIQDRLAAYNAQYRPGQDMNQSFAEVRLMGSKGGALVPDTLYVCTSGQLRRARLEGAERAAFICVGGDGVEDRPALRCAHFFTVNREGVCLADLMNDLLDCFQRLNDWERRLEEAILRGKSAQELVDLSAPVFEYNYFLFWDASYNLLAYTKGVEPPNEKIERIVRQGFFAKEMTDELVRMNYIKNAMAFTKPTFRPATNYMNLPFSRPLWWPSGCSTSSASITPRASPARGWRTCSRSLSASWRRTSPTGRTPPGGGRAGPTAVWPPSSRTRARERSTCGTGPACWG